ncbi:Rv0804 family intramembrane glutamic endopeptidase [Mycobacterium sp. 4D054]|uniref:Rv0804 family intramembrane glutamic endopeptidase n=1 Tax=Mycobacterium sp. 4D054 TaxID=3457440 RepID=UPI003FCFD647
MRSGVRAAAAAGVLLVWSAVAPRIPPRWNPLPQAAFGVAVAMLGKAPLGLRPPALREGLRWGSAAAVPVALTVAASTVSPAVRAGMAGRELPAPAAPWLLMRIPFGTVWSEEVAFRAALGAAAEQAYGRVGGQVFAAVVFGLSHIPDARAAKEPLLGTVLVTGAAGWVFSWLYAKSGSVVAPMLAHLAVNEAGAVAALAVQRRSTRS